MNDSLAASGSGANSSIMCSEGFYVSDMHNGTCRPQCGVWTQQSRRDTLRETIMSSIACSIATIASIAVVVLACTKQRDFLLVFPSVYLVYLSVVVPLRCVLFFAGRVANTALFCSSDDLVVSLDNPTHFCNITGVTSIYAGTQLILFAFFHSASLFWGIRFPFHYRKYKQNGYLKYIHFSTVAIAVLVPLIPGLSQLSKGFVPTRFPISTCVGRSGSVYYYTLVLPVSILLGVTVSLLVLIYWTILKEFVIKKISRGKKNSRITKAQLKIMFILWYYIIIGILGLASFAFLNTTTDSTLNTLRDLFQCESVGIHPNEDNCAELRRSVTFRPFINARLVVNLLLGLIPVFVLIFTFDVSLLKCKKIKSHPATKSAST